MFFFCCCVVFFFQAEDGIRDLVRSRGLGDVYKRQGAMGMGLGGPIEGYIGRVDNIIMEDFKFDNVITLSLIHI